MDIKLSDFFRQTSLTASQMECIAWMERFLDSKDEVFILKGYAGTGKTFMLSGLSSYFQKMEHPFLFLAPTGRAARVLRKKTGCAAQTIHKMIYRLDSDASVFDDGDDDYKLYFDLLEYQGPTSTLFIVDESSMVSDTYSDNENLKFGSGKLLADLIKFVHVSGTNRKLLFVGDYAQLPPVGSNHSPALSSAYLSDQFGLHCIEFELTDVYRQAKDSAILQVSMAIRDSIRSSSYDTFVIDANECDIIEIPIEQSVDTFQFAWSTSDDESVILIAHTNAHVYKYNRAIRKRLGFASNEMGVGDQLLVVKNTIVEGIPLFNGDFIKVIDISPGVEVRKVRLRGEKEDTVLNYRTITAELLGEPVSITVKVYENLLFSPERDLSRLDRRAIMADFRMRHPWLKPKDEFFAAVLRQDPYFNALQVKFGYAVTCHKSQGGEWKEAIVDFRYSSSIYSEEYFRWAYTAITRAKVKLHMVYPPLRQNRAVQSYESSEALAMAARLTDQLASFNLRTHYIDYHQHQFILHLRTAGEVQRIAVYYDSYYKITSYRLLDGIRNLQDRVLASITESWVKPINEAQELKHIKTSMSKTITESVVPYLEQTITGYKRISASEHQDAVKVKGIIRGSELTLIFYQNKEREFTKLVVEKGSSLLSKNVISYLYEMLNVEATRL
jgi:hypothetical protein